MSVAISGSPRYSQLYIHLIEPVNGIASSWVVCGVVLEVEFMSATMETCKQVQNCLNQNACVLLKEILSVIQVIEGDPFSY